MALITIAAAETEVSPSEEEVSALLSQVAAGGAVGQVRGWLDGVEVLAVLFYGVHQLHGLVHFLLQLRLNAER